MTIKLVAYSWQMQRVRGNTSDLEKEFTAGTNTNDLEEEEDQDDVNEGTSSLHVSRHSSNIIYGSKENLKKEEDIVLPNIIYASPARPHLPSPSTSNSRIAGTPCPRKMMLILVTPGMYLPYNWRTPAMVPYDVQAHPFNRAPSASPQTITISSASRNNRYTALSDTEVTGGSSR